MQQTKIQFAFREFKENRNTREGDPKRNLHTKRSIQLDRRRCRFLAYIRISNEMKNKFNAIRLPFQCQRVVSAWAVARHKLHYIRATKHRNIHAEEKREKNVQLNLNARIFTVKASIEFLEN